MGTNWTADDVNKLLGRGTSAPSSPSGNKGGWTADDVTRLLNPEPKRTKTATVPTLTTETPKVETVKSEVSNPRSHQIPTLTATSSGGRNYASQMLKESREQKVENEKSAQLAEIERLSAMTDDELESHYADVKKQSEDNNFLKRVFTGQGKSDFDAYVLADNERNRRLDTKNSAVIEQNADVADKVKALYDYFQTEKAIAIDTGDSSDVDKYFADEVINGNRQIVSLLQNPETVGEAYRVANSLGYGGEDIETLKKMGSDYLAIAEVYQSLKEMGYDPSSLVKTYDRNQNAVQDAETAQFATEHGVKASLESIPQNVASGLGGSLATLDSWLMGKPLDDQSNAFDYTRKVQTTRGTVGNNIRTDENGNETVGGKVGAFLYDAGMGMADSATNMALSMGNPFVMAGLTATQAGASSAYDVATRGGTVNQMAATGVASALAEGISEAISLGNLKSLKNAAKGGGKGLLKAMGKQSLVEGSEEFASESLNKVADYLINKDLSASEIQYRQYIAEGMSEEEARKKVSADIFVDILKSAGMGAISGGVFGAGANLVGSATNGTQAIPVLEKTEVQTETQAEIPVLKASQEQAQNKNDGVMRLVTGQPVSQDLQETIKNLSNNEDVDYDYIMDIPEIDEAEARAEAKMLNGESISINTPERTAMRDQVVQELLSRGSWQVDSKGKGAYNGVVESGKQVVFVIGLPASGKSSATANPISQHYKARIIDSDDAKTSSVFAEDYDNGYGAGYLHEESKDIADSVLAQSIANGDNIVLPIIGADFDKLVRKMRTYVDMGYETTLVLNELPSNKALGRALSRFVEEGRYIPLDVLAGYGNKPTEVYERIMRGEGNVRPNNYARVSNDVARGNKPQTIESGGKCQEVYGSGRASGGEINQDARGNGSQVQGSTGAEITDTANLLPIQETSLEKAQEATDSTSYNTKKIDVDSNVNKELSKLVGMYGKDDAKQMYGQLNAKLNEYIATGSQQCFDDALVTASKMDELMEGNTYTYENKSKKNSVKAQNKVRESTYPSGVMVDVIMNYADTIRDAKNARAKEKMLATGEIKVSKFRTNTVENSGIATEAENKMYAPKEDFTYETVSEKKSMERAQYSLNNVRDYIPNMMASEQGTFEGSDIDAFMLEYQRAIENARANNDVQGYEYASSLLRKVRSESTKNAQALQAIAKWSRNTPEGQLLDVMNAVDTKVAKAVGKKNLEKAKNKANKIADQAQALDIAADYDQALQKLKEACQSELGTDWQAVFDDIIANTENISYTSVLEILRKHGKLSKTIAEYLDNSTKMQSAVLDYLYEIQENSYDMDSREARIIMAKAGKVIAKAIPSSVSDMVKQTLYNNMLGNFRTIVSRNTFGNLGFAIMEQARQPLAEAIDKAVAKKTGYRTTTGWSKEKQGAYVQGALRGFNEEISDLKLSIEQYRNGETSGLHTSRTGENTLLLAVKNNTSAFNGDLGDGRIGKVLTASNNLLAKLFNMSNDLIQHGMRGGDRVFYEATKDQSTVELKKLLKENYKIDTNEMDVDEYIDAASTLIALEAVYQNDTLLSNAFTNMKKALADISTDIIGVDVITQPAMPFVKTPSNIIEKAVQYSPLGFARNALVTRGEINRGEFNQRRYVDETSRNIVGTLLLIGAVCAVSQGLVTGAYDEDKDVKNAQKEAGMQEYALRLGNTQMDVGYIPVLGSTIEAGAAAKSAYDKSRKENKGVLSSIGKGASAAMGQTVQSIFDQSMLSSLSDLLSGTGYSSDNTLIQNAGEVALGLIGQMTPSLVRQVAQSTDKYQRYAGEYGTAENNLNYLVMNNIPVLRQTQEIKYGNAGQPMLQNDGRSTASKFIENMILPGKITQERSTALYKEATRLYDKTGLNTAYLPTSKMSDIRTDAYEPTTAEFTEYKRIRGLYSSDAGEALISSDYYGSLSDEDKAKALADIYAVMKQLAKEETVPDYTITSNTKECAIYKEQGIDGLIGYMQYKHLLSEDDDATTVNMISRLQETYDTDEERGAALYFSKSQLSKSATKAYEDKGYDGLYDYYNYMAQADPKDARPTREETIMFLNTQTWMPKSTKAYWFDLMSSSTNNPYR